LGSLLSEESACRTCPNLKNFRYVKLSGYKRVFNKTDSFLALNNNIPTDSKKYACLSALPDRSVEEMYVSVFDIPESDWPSIVYREFEYRLTEVPFREFDKDLINKGVICMGDFDSDEDCYEHIKDDPARLGRFEEFRSKYHGPLWRYDLEPNPDYLNRCLDTLKEHQPGFLDNFMDTTFLGDGRTIREFLSNS